MGLIINETSSGPELKHTITKTANLNESVEVVSLDVKEGKPVVLSSSANYAPAGPPGPPGPAGADGVSESYVSLAPEQWYRSLGHGIGNNTTRVVSTTVIAWAPFRLPAGDYDSGTFRVVTGVDGATMEMVVYTPTGQFLGSLGTADVSTAGQKTLTGNTVSVPTNGQLLVGLRAYGENVNVWGYRSGSHGFPTHSDFEYSVVAGYDSQIEEGAQPPQQLPSSMRFGSIANQTPILGIRKSQ